MHELHAADKRLYDHVVSEIYPKLVDRYDTKTSQLPQLVRFRPWSTLKRNLLYKPAAKLRQKLLRAS